MKRKLKIVLMTSIIMLAAMGAFLWKMNDTSKKLQKENAKLITEEKDLVENQKGKAIDDVKDIDIIPLYTSGAKKNVITTKFDSVSDIYNPDKSAAAEENLTDIKKRSSFTAINPLWAYNPYGTNRSSMYLYFQTDGKCYCRYTISVKNDKIPDFTRTLANGASGNVSTEHEYQIIGLVPGQTNFITLKLYNKENKLSQKVTYKIKMPKSGCKAQTILKSGPKYTRNRITNGLYMVFGDGSRVASSSTKIVTKKIKKNGRTITKRIKKTTKKASKRYAILMYDNSGVLRGEIPLDDYCGNNIEKIYDNIVYASADDKISEVNALGQVMKTFNMNGYKQSGEFAYDGFGNIYVIASERGKNKTPRSKVLKIELETSKASIALDMNDFLKTVYKTKVRETGKKNTDWIGLNSIQVAGTNKLLLSSESLSSIFKISNVNSLLPKVDYIIADKKIWKKYKSLKKKVLKKALPQSDDATATPEPTPEVKSILGGSKKQELFKSQYGQNYIRKTKSSSLADGQYYLTMLNNNSGKGASPDGKSYYYRYLVDETTKTYMMSYRKAFSQTKKDGNISKKGDIYLYCDADSRTFQESDDDGKLIKKFKINKKIKRVYKDDWKNFWFV